MQEQLDLNLVQNSYLEIMFRVALVSFFILSLSLISFAQETPWKIKAKAKYLNKLDSIPEFPGGEAAFDAYFQNMITYPSKALDKKVEGVVRVTFRVNKYGKIDKVKLKEGIGEGCDEVSLKAVEKMPDWEPAFKKKRRINCKVEIPIRFSLRY